MPKRIIFPIIIALLVSCNHHLDIRKPKKLTREAFLQTLNDEDRRKSLIEWTSDTAFATDAELMLLLDTLYQHVREDSFPDKIKTEEKWMNNYCEKLATYYDSHNLGPNTTTTYAKADSVLKKGMWLLQLDCHWSTMEMIINNSAELTFDTYKEYGLLTQIIRSCKNEREKDLFYREWDLYRQVHKAIETIGSNIIILDCWGGSMSGPATTHFYLELMQSRREMYERIIDMLNSNLQDNTLSNSINAEKHLLSQYKSSFKKAVDKVCWFRKDHDDEDKFQEFLKTKAETETTLKEIQHSMKEWIKLIEEIDNEISHDNNRHLVKRTALQMLKEWTNAVSEI